MEELSVMITSKQRAHLIATSNKRLVSMSALVREIIDAHIAEANKEPAPASVPTAVPADRIIRPSARATRPDAEFYAPRNRRISERFRELEDSAECLAEIVSRAERIDTEERARVGSNVDGLPPNQSQEADAGNRQP
jgi:hypothetical protein